MRLARGGWFWVVVLAVAILAGLSQRITVNAILPAANVWDILVPVQADLYLAAYLFVPIWIFRLSIELPNRADETWLLRCGSRLRWLAHSGIWALGQAATLLLVWLVACLVLAAGLPWATGWSHTADPDGNAVLLASLQDAGLGPIPSWMLQWIAYLGMLVLIFTVLAVTTLVAAKPWQRYLAAAAVYLIMVVTIRGGLPVGHFMFVYQAAVEGEPAWLPTLVPFLIMALIVAGFAGAGAVVRSSQRVGVERLGLTGTYLAVVVGGIAATAINLGNELNLPDLLLVAFYGFEANQLNLGVYSFFLLTFAGFNLLHVVSAEQRLWPLYLLVSIRSGSPRRWMGQAWRDIATKAAALMVGLTAVSAGIVVASGHPLSSPGTGLMIYQFLVNGTLQLITTTGIALLVAYLTRSRGAVLAAIAVVAVIQTPMINIGQVLPLGLNAMGLATNWPTVLGFTGYLAAAVLAISGLSFVACSHHLRHTLERIAT
ncbi:MAG: hypothetical protein QM650_18510 [Microlunatus sp.]